MKQPVEVDECEFGDVPESAVLAVQRKPLYGTVEGLDEEELADPFELERQVLAAEWGPVLALPVRSRRTSFRPEVDESGGVEWGAFASVDFERTMPEFDKARYKADKLNESLKDLLILLSIVKERIPSRAKFQVLRCATWGWLDTDEIVHTDVRAWVRMVLRARKLQQEIKEIRDSSWKRRQARAQAVLAMLD